MGEVLTGEALLLVLTCNDWISEQSSTSKLSKLSLSVTFSGVSIIFLASAGDFLIISMSLFRYKLGACSYEIFDNDETLH